VRGEEMDRTYEQILNDYTGECYAHANGCERRSEWVEKNREELIEHVASLRAQIAAAEAECERLRGTINDMTEHQVVLGYEIERLRAALAAGEG
jgi:chromosome segregation ATPase